MIEKLTEYVLAGGMLSGEEALALSRETDKDALYEGAHRITRRFMGNKFDTCSIINAKSGNCSEDCKWCAQSGHYPTRTTLYPLLPASECVRHAVYNRKQGIGRFALVTSGKRVSEKELDDICSIVKEIKRSSDVKCCASLGLLDKEQLLRLKDCGVESYHCNIETAPSYFPSLCTTHTVEEKMNTIQTAREVGFRICCGGIVGMGETMEQRIEMAVFLQQHCVLSIPLNLLQPIPDTPLGEKKLMPAEEFLTTVALFRYLNPSAYLRFSGGRALLPGSVQRKALYIGVNAAIIGDLLTTIGSEAENDKEMFVSSGYSLTENTDWEK